MSHFRNLSRLEGLTGNNPYKAKCPCHDDRSASLSITVKDDGKLLLHCFAGCKFGDIMAALESTQEEVRYSYEEVEGQTVFTKVRKPGKRFYIEGEVRPILFKQPEALADSSRLLFIVEGEKDVLTLHERGLLAVCGYEGSSKWREEYSRTLTGRSVVLLPDNDEPGRNYMEKVSTSLIAHGCQVRLLTMQTLYALLDLEAPPKSDVTDWYAAGGTTDLLKQAVKTAPLLRDPSPTPSTAHEEPAEQSVIASLMLQPQVQGELFSLLSHDSFSGVFCRIIFQTAERLFYSGLSVDRVTVSSQLDPNARSYLDRLLETTLPSTNLQEHANIILDRYSRRSLIYQCSELSRLAQDTSVSTEEVLDQAESRVMGLRKISSVADVNPIELCIRQALRTIENRVELGGDLGGLSTGIPELDSYTDGLQAPDLILLAARPGMGKTALAMNIVEHVTLRQDKRVLVFSLEMSAHQLVTRLLSSLCLLDGQMIRRGYLGSSELRSLTEEAERLSKSRLQIDDTASISINQLRAKARRAHRKSPLDLIVVDYLQLMRGSNRVSDRRDMEIAEISAGLKALAKELNVPVIALSQLNRGLEQRQEKRPNNSDLRESGALEQDADIILFIYRECVYNPESSQKDAELIVSKHRNGPLGTILLEFDGSRTKFSSPTEEPKQEPAQEYYAPEDLI